MGMWCLFVTFLQQEVAMEGCRCPVIIEPCVVKACAAPPHAHTHTYPSPQVSNVGLSSSGSFSVGLYLSKMVDPLTRGCTLDNMHPLRDAVQLATYRVESGLRAGEARLVQFPRAVTVEPWMASQWHTGRDALHQCLFVYGDDGGDVFELQTSEADNIAAVGVRLLDLVDLQVRLFPDLCDHPPRATGMSSTATFAR